MERSCRRRRPSSRAASMVTLFTSPLLLLLVVVLLLVHSAPVDAQRCAHYKQDELLDRLDARLALCMDEQLHRDALESVKDRFATNEYDRQHPLALVAFSNSSKTLDALAGAVASSLFGEKPASRQSSVQVLDFAQLIPTQLLASTNHDVKQVLRAALASSLGACPERTLFIMENVQVLDDATLPVLDTFLDPLNGKRAHFQQHQRGGSSKLLDSTQSVFLFLYKVERAAFEQTAMKMLSPSHGNEVEGDATPKLSQHKAWRDFLMAKWMRKEGFAEEFTPQAFVGRLTEGVTLFASDDQDDAAVSDTTSDQQASRAWQQQCLAHKRNGDGVDDANERSESELFLLQSRAGVLRAISWGLIPALALLYRAKLWTQETAVKRAKRGPIKKGAKKTKRAGKKAKKKY
ncbi:hypothetical protein Gpo141_00007489 [Globisporangium polare]